MPKTHIILVTFAAVFFCDAVPLHAQDRASPVEPNAVFIPQAQPRQAKSATAPARRPAPRAARQDQAQATVAPPGARVGALPNGASAISETYGDWTLNCSTDKGAKVCTLSQAQVSKEGQRGFAIELRIAKDGASEGTILMPFGLKLEAGVILKLDDRDLGEGLRFSTCVAQGCLLPVTFPTAGMNAIRNAKAFAVAALSVSNGQSLTFNVSLNGFAIAVDRAIQLAS
ncbi:invasion associated locus B family protein [Bradyrhizobium australiense]|uniref:Invasion associated locus B family protein n=1 Tax=Bradyrhizobium australiense TaxID=2721161 RepID=A0A7Y4LZD7_9BRAD|nr:invasion associated locus B family protein [Bradyrhizobium australiense]NOJ43680.1 invasion associated locus B family protein [Bradyrhizobium australiense]